MSFLALPVYLARAIFRLPPALRLLVLTAISAYSVITIYLATRLVILVWGRHIRTKNAYKRRAVMRELGIDESVKRRKLLGLFHPYCNAGGGGERVLWAAVAYHQRADPDLICAVYTGDVSASKTEIITKVKERFDIILNSNTLVMVYLTTRSSVEDSTWPMFTLLGQSLGSMRLGYEALTSLIPDIYLDTMGYAFTYPIFRNLGAVPVGAYVHYPTISSEMINRVQKRQSGVTNQGAIARNQLLSKAKLLYYLLFAELYSLCLRQADFVMVNSSWTKNHVNSMLRPWLHRDEDEDGEDGVETQRSLLSASHTSSASASASEDLRNRRPSATSLNSPPTASTCLPTVPPPHKFKKAQIVYPPCDTTAFSQFPLNPRQRNILSISQFRPEKAQHVQIEAFATLLRRRPEYISGDKQVKLILAGSVRNAGDGARVMSLRDLAKREGVADNVAFEVNVPWEELKGLLRTSLVGMNTMVDEHFGINVVEFMAAGLCPLVHASGGPLKDIVVPLRSLRTGFYASSVEGYADQLEAIFSLDEDDLTALRDRARELAERKFSTEGFERAWADGWTKLLSMEGEVEERRRRWDQLRMA